MNSSHALCGGPRLVQRDPVTDTLTDVGMHSEESTTGQSPLAAVWPLLGGGTASPASDHSMLPTRSVEPAPTTVWKAAWRAVAPNRAGAPGTGTRLADRRAAQPYLLSPFPS